MRLLFQVCLTGQDCEQISHKDLNCSAETQTRLSGLIKAEPPPSTPTTTTTTTPPCPQCAPPACSGISHCSGAFLWRTWGITVSPLFFSVSSTVTMVLFLIGISTAVNNSSHENQTAGKRLHSQHPRQQQEVSHTNFWEMKDKLFWVCENYIPALYSTHREASLLQPRCALLYAN